MPRPTVTLKLATSLDGKIALANGESEWITCEASREAGRRLRGKHDAIVVGANTAVIDNPQLTTRIHGLTDPIRVVFDSRLRISTQSNLVKTAKQTPAWIFCDNAQAEHEKRIGLEDLGVRVFPVETNNTGLSVSASLSIMKNHHVSSLLVEGGGRLASSFIKEGVVDVIEWFRAPMILGGDARPCISDLNLKELDLAKMFRRVTIRELGDDIHERYERL